MMTNNDPRTIQHLIADRQHRLLVDAAHTRHPSALRIAAGMALIRLGETLRGHSKATLPEITNPVAGPTVRRLRTA